jgi:hypothetical protein
MRLTGYLSCIGMLSLAAGAAIAQTAAPPAYSVVRYNEDYTYLRDSSRRSDFFDPIKFIPLNSEGDWYLSLGGQARYRYEWFNNTNFGAGPQDHDGYHLTRLLADVDFHAGDYFRIFAQGKSAMIDERIGGARPQDADQADIQQLFADVKLPVADQQSLTFRFGRQELSYGKERLIGVSDFNNNPRTFEGAKVIYAMPGNQLDVFWVRPVLINDERLNNGDRASSFEGIYDTLSLPWVLGQSASSKIEGYALGLNKADNAANGAAIDSDTYTLGGRFSTNPKPWDLDIEPDYQFGRSGFGPISAWSLASEGGYTFSDVELTPRAFVGFDIASGDDSASDPAKQTFNQLFPTGHIYFGYIDAVGRQNIIDLHPGVECTIAGNKSWAQKLTLRSEYHAFWRESTDDALYNASGAIQRAAGTNRDQFVGSELDLLVNWQIERHTLIYAGYSHFFAGDFIQNTGKGSGADKDIDFLYAAMVFTF